MTIFPCLFVIILFLSPQLWVKPILGLPVDYILYPIWFAALFITGGFSNYKNSTTKYFIFFIIWMVLSSIANGSIFVEVKDIGNILFYYFKLFLLYILVANSLKDIKGLKYYMAFIVLGALILSIEGIQHKLTGIGWAGQRLGWVAPEALAAGETGRTRWVGIFDGPGVFCVIYILAFPFALFGIKQAKYAALKISSFIILILLSIAIYFNGSRGGMIGALAIIVLHYGQNIKLSKLKALAGILIALAIYLSLPSYYTEINDSSKSTYHRIEMWRESTEMVIYNPVFGIGRGNFRPYTNKLDPHNSTLLILGETGFVGVFLWLTFIYMSLKNLYFYIRSSDDIFNVDFIKALALSVIGYYVCSLFVVLEYETFYLLLGACSAVGRLVDEEVTISKKELLLIASGLSAFIVFVYIYSYWFLGNY